MGLFQYPAPFIRQPNYKFIHTDSMLDVFCERSLTSASKKPGSEPGLYENLKILITR